MIAEYRQSFAFFSNAVTTPTYGRWEGGHIQISLGKEGLLFLCLSVQLAFSCNTWSLHRQREYCSGCLHCCWTFCCHDPSYKVGYLISLSTLDKYAAVRWHLSSSDLAWHPDRKVVGTVNIFGLVSGQYLAVTQRSGRRCCPPHKWFISHKIWPTCASCELYIMWRARRES